MTFEVGDKAVHPAHGVGEVTSIEKREIAGNKKNFYILKILDSGMTVMVPIDGVERLGLRSVISKRDAKKVLDILKQDEVAVTSQPWNRRYREYMEMLKSGSPFEVAKVLRDLYRLKSDKELSFGERRLLEQARNLLVTELALARKCKEQRVEQDIDSIPRPRLSRAPPLAEARSLRGTRASTRSARCDPRSPPRPGGLRRVRRRPFSPAGTTGETRPREGARSPAEGDRAMAHPETHRARDIQHRVDRLVRELRSQDRDLAEAAAGLPIDPAELADLRARIDAAVERVEARRRRAAAQPSLPLHAFAMRA